MEKLGFSKQQIACHKRRVRECFVNDLIERGYNGVRTSQMVWAAYFINCMIIEVGNLQYEYNREIDKVQIHIPSRTNLDIDKVKKSLITSKKEIKKYFNIENKQYILDSWLLSKQVSGLLDDKSNIKKFQALFDIQEGEICVNDILLFVYDVVGFVDYKQLLENTSLQKKIKNELIKGTIFRKGCGVLNWFLFDNNLLL